VSIEGEKMSSEVRDELGAHRSVSAKSRPERLRVLRRRLLFWRNLSPLPWLPNALTVARVPMTLVFIAVFVWLWQSGNDAVREWGAGLFVLISLTDFIDGDYARHHDCESDFGRIADPIADKFLMISALVVLMRLEVLPSWAWWAIGGIAVREVGVTLLRLWLLHRVIVQPADRGGKLKMLLQFALVALCLWPLPLVEPVVLGRIVLLLAAAGLTVFTGVHYVRVGLASATGTKP
jgi:CDP-diacylglycerol--glycerol-3-phosphate 3-phosphatidyltransferase